MQKSWATKLKKVLLTYLGYYEDLRLSILEKITEYSGISVIIKKQYIKRERYKYRIMVLHRFVARNNVVGIATRYGLGGPGIESRRGGHFFPHPSRLALWAIQPPVQWVQVSSQGVKQSECDFDHTPSGAEVKDKVELHFYPPLGHHCPF